MKIDHTVGFIDEILGMYNPKPAQFQAQRTATIKEYSLPQDEDTLLIAPDAALYTQMRESERKLDWTMARKVLEMQETVTKVIRVCRPVQFQSQLFIAMASQKRRILRVFVTHTAHGQHWQVQGGDAPVDFNTGKGIPSWELKIEGKLLDEVSDILMMLHRTRLNFLL